MTWILVSIILIMLIIVIVSTIQLVRARATIWRLKAEKMSLEFDLTVAKVQADLNLKHARALNRFVPNNIDLSALKDDPSLSQSTRDLIGRIVKDPRSPVGWGGPSSSYGGSTRTPSTEPQPQIRSHCIQCGRPIMWQGGTDMRFGWWADHAGATKCDGALTGMPRGAHVPAERQK